MKKNLKTRQNNGITLIALVITIIVMLILVAVTISMAVNGGLFEYASNAGAETNTAIKAEQQLADGRIKIDGKWYASIDDYLDNNPIKQGIVLSAETLKLEIEADYDVTTSTPVTGQLTATLNEIEGTVTWASDNEAVATVGNTGLVIANSAGTAKITASCIFEGETYTATCNVTVEEPKITSSEVSDDLTTYLGQPVNYGVEYDGKNEWEIFYADEDHIYIITKGHLLFVTLTLTGYNGTSDLTAENGLANYPAVAEGLLNKTYDPTAAGTDQDPILKYSSDNSNMKATQYLLDSTVWKDYAPETNEFADWAIGGPTFELFVKSYNAYYPNNAVTLEAPIDYGYANPLSTSNSVPAGTYLNHSTHSAYWLACPSSSSDISVRYVGGSSAKVHSDFYSYDYDYAIRPVVCLKSNVKITWNKTTSQYDLSLVTEN